MPSVASLVSNFYFIQILIFVGKYKKRQSVPKWNFKLFSIPKNQHEKNIDPWVAALLG